MAACLRFVIVNTVRTGDKIIQLSSGLFTCWSSSPRADTETAQATYKIHNNHLNTIKKKRKKIKWCLYRPGVAQRVGRGIALLFHDRGTRRGWVVSRTPRPHFTPGKDPVPIVQEAGWATGTVWKGGKSRPHRDSIPDRPARSQSLYRLSY